MMDDTDDGGDSANNRKTMLKVVIAGECQSGKSELVHRFAGEEFSPEYNATFSPEYSVKEVKVGGRQVLLQIWDISGREEFFGYLGVSFYRDSDCCILVYDVTNKATFEMLDKWLNDFLIQANPWNMATFPIVVVGNKTDLNETRQVPRQEAEQWCHSKACNIAYIETSAKSNADVRKLFLTIAQHVLALESLTLSYGLTNNVVKEFANGVITHRTTPRNGELIGSNGAPFYRHLHHHYPNTHHNHPRHHHHHHHPNKPNNNFPDEVKRRFQLLSCCFNIC